MQGLGEFKLCDEYKTTCSISCDEILLIPTIDLEEIAGKLKEQLNNNVGKNVMKVNANT